MKRSIIILAILLFALPGHAQMLQGIVGQATAAAGPSCSADTDYVGYKTVSVAATVSIGADGALAMLVTPVCASGCTSGAAATAYIQHWGTGADNVKICLWADDGDDAPDTGDALVGCTAELSSSTSEEIVSAALSGTITCATKYWVGGISDSTTWLLGYNDVGGTVPYSADAAGWYASPPSTMSGTWSAAGTKRYVVYVTIGP